MVVFLLYGRKQAADILLYACPGRGDPLRQGFLGEAAARQRLFQFGSQMRLLSPSTVLAQYTQMLEEQNAAYRKS